MNRLATNGEVIARTSAPYPNPKDSWLPTTIGWALLSASRHSLTTVVRRELISANRR